MPKPIVAPVVALSVASAILVSAAAITRTAVLDPTGAPAPAELHLTDGLLSLNQIRLSGRVGAGEPSTEGFASRRAWVQPSDRTPNLESVHVLSDEYFREVIGNRPAALGSDDIRAGAVLSDDAWRRWYRASPQALGSTIEVNGTRLPIVGVSASGFRGLDAANPAAVFVGLHFGRLVGLAPTDSSVRWLRGVARVRPPGVPPDLGALDTSGVSWIPFNAALARGTAARSLRIALVLLLAVGGVTVLVAALSYTSWAIATVEYRLPEYALRSMLGSGRKSVLLLVSRTLLAPVLPAMLVGSVLAMWLLDGIHALGAVDGLPARVQANLTVGDAVTGGLLSATLAAACCLPALLRVVAIREGSLVATFRSNSVADRTSLGLARATAVAAQVAVAVCGIGVAAGALATLHSQATRILGYEAGDRVVVVQSRFGESGRPQLSDLLRARASLEASAGVVGVAFAQAAPLGGLQFVQDFTTNLSARTTRMAFNVVSGSYFSVVGLPLRSGRGFSGAVNEAIVNESALALLAGQADPTRLEIVADEPRTRLRVVGVVADSHYESLVEGDKPIVYLPASGTESGNWVLVARLDRAERVTMLRSLLDEKGKRGQFEATTLQARRAELLRVPQFLALSAVVLSAALIGLASGSVWNLIVLIVRQQRRAMAIRQALGATPGMAAAVPLSSLRSPVLAGGLTGAAASVVLSRADISSLTGAGQTLAIPLFSAAAGMACVAVAGIVTYRVASRLEVFASLRDL